MNTAYFGNPWIGMFVKTNNEITMLPLDSMQKFDDLITLTLKTKPIKMGIADSNLLGVYIAMNSKGVVLPNVATEKDIAQIKGSGVNFYVSKDKNNANGNNIVLNDNGGLVNPNISYSERKEMEGALGVELVPSTIAEYSTVGSICIATNEGFLTHFKTSDEDMKLLKEILKVPGNKGTVNTGTGFVGYGVIVNKNGYVVGEDTTAYEIGRVEEAFGMIDR